MYFLPLHTIHGFDLLCTTCPLLLSFYPRLTPLGVFPWCGGVLVWYGQECSSFHESSSISLTCWYFFLWVAGFSVSGLLEFIWSYRVCSFLESTKISSCSWVKLWDSVMLVLVRFDIASLSSIESFASSCSVSAVIIWESVTCLWYSEALYPCATDVAFLQI